MFHKEGSIQGGGGGTKKKAVDVPVKKSDRRKLLERAKHYFLAGESSQGGHGDVVASSISTILETSLVQGNLSVRQIQMQGGKVHKMMVYLKSPSKEDIDNTRQQGETKHPSTEQWPYTSSFQFVWMTLEEKGKVVHETPTVALWSVLSAHLSPDYIRSRSIQVPHAVSKYVCRGADLMRAGMRSLPSCSGRPNIVPIVAQGNPQPFAVGLLVKPEDPFGVGSKGIGVEIWNAYGDDLWRATATSSSPQSGSGSIGGFVNTAGGAPFDDGNYGNVGFQEGKWVLPIIDGHEEESSDDDEIDDTDPQVQCIATEQIQHGVEDLKVTEETVEVSAATEAPAAAPLSADEVLHQAVLRGLLTLKNKDLPMIMTSFYSQYVLPNRLPATTIDMKATTYKKFGNYLKEQIQRRLLQAGPDTSNKKNKDPMATLIAFDKRHEDFEGVKKPEISKARSTEKTKLVLVSLYTIPHHWTSLLRLDEDDVKAVRATSEARRGTGMLTGAEIKSVLDSYIVKESLIPPARPAYVQMDAGLTQALFKGQSDPPQVLTRKDLVRAFMAKLGNAYALVQMPGSEIVKLARGSPPPIEIEVSMRQSKKFVTRVRGMEDYGIDAEYFAKDVAKRLACASSVDTEAADGRPALKKGRAECIFQGSIVAELEALLIGDESLSSHGGVKGSEYSVPKQSLSITLRKGVPGRKKN